MVVVDSLIQPQKNSGFKLESIAFPRILADSKERIFGSTLFFAENANIHRNVGVFTSSSISMSELGERCFVQQRMAAKESSGDHQKLSRVEPGASTYASICCF